MKNILILVLFLNFYSHAESKFMKDLKRYGIPCGISLIVGAALGEAEAGVIGCAAASATVYSVDAYQARPELKEEDKKRFEDKIQNSISDEMVVIKSKFKKAIEQSLDKALKQNENDLAEIFLLQRTKTMSIVRKVIASQLTEMKVSMQAEFFEKIAQGKIIPRLTQNIRNEVEKVSRKVFEENKTEIIRKAVSGTLKQVVLKEVGKSK